MLVGGAFPPLPRDEACVSCTRDLCTGSTRTAQVSPRTEKEHGERERERGGRVGGEGNGRGKARVARGERELVGSTFSFFLSFFLLLRFLSLSSLRRGHA